MNIETTIIVIFQSVGFGVVSSLASQRKNRDSMLWFFAGFAFSIFGFIASLLVESKADCSKQFSKWATASFLFSILSWLFVGLAAIPAVVCGHIAASRIRESPSTYAGETRYTIGLVLGYANLVTALAAGSYFILAS